MTNKKIVVAYDGSPDSKNALKIAADFAKPLSAEILLVSVFEVDLWNLPDESNFTEFAKIESSFKEMATEKAEEGKRYCEEKEVPVHVEILQGNAVTEIINYAQRENACMIVAGTRGLGGFKRLLLGSTAQALITYSDIPVLITK